MKSKVRPKVIILAAGEGSRLRPLTLDRPKCLVEADGKSLLDRQLAVLASEKFSEIVIVGGYCADMLIRPEYKLIVNNRYADTNMVWSLFSAEAELDGEVIISYGDIVYSKAILNQLLEFDGDIAVAIDLDWKSYWYERGENPLDDAETLKLAEDGNIIEIGQKPTSLDQIQGQYIGLMKFSAVGIGWLKKAFVAAKKSGNICGKSVERAYMTDILQTLIDDGRRLDSVQFSGDWVEIDTVSDLKLGLTIQRLKNIELSLKD